MEWVFVGGGLLGLLVGLVGGVWLLVEAFRESVAWGVGSFFCGLVQLLFVVLHWRQAKRPFLLSCAGVGLSAVAGVGLEWAQNRGSDTPFDPQAVAVPEFPADLGPPEALAGRVTRHEVRLGSSQGGYYDPPGHGGRVWVYLPPGWETAPQGSLPCVLIAPAGTSGLTGVRLSEADEAEHLPYAQAGFVVVAYELDGALVEGDETDAGFRRGYLAFREARAGLVDARNALELVLQRLPRVAPRAIFAAGHSSAGGAALLLAAHEPRLAGCVAYAPLSDLSQQSAWISGAWALPGVRAFAQRASPVTHLARVRCPVFLFHARDDSRIDVEDSRRLAGLLRGKGTPTTLEEVASGDHYESMIRDGIPAGIAWLEERAGAIAGVRPAPLPAVRPAARPGGAEEPERPAAGAARVDWDDPQVVLTRVGSDDPETRREALLQWQRRGQDKPEGARLAMLQALRQAVADPPVQRVLLRSLEERPLGAREALGCLAVEGLPGELRHELLVRVVRHPDREVPPADAAAVLERQEETPDALVDEGLLIYGRPRPGVAARLVAARGPEWAREQEARALFDRLPPEELLPLVQAEAEGTRLLGIALLGARGAEAALAPLAALLRDPAPAVRQEAAGALGGLGEARAVVPILDALNAEKDEPTRARLRRALGNLPAAAVAQVLEQLLQDPAPAQRLVAVQGLRAYASPPTVRQLGKALEDTDPSVRKAALEALSELRTARVQGVPETVRQLATAIGQLARSQDADEKRLARHLYYQLTGRLP